MELEIEIIKAQATLDNIITCLKANADIDILGSVLALKDQLDRVDMAADKID